MKPHCRTPQIWCGYNNSNKYEDFDVRLRILYPNGESAYCFIERNRFRSSWEIGAPEIVPCWEYGEDKTFSARIKRMKIYDKRGGRKTEFLGNV